MIWTSLGGNQYYKDENGLVQGSVEKWSNEFGKGMQSFSGREPNRVYLGGFQNLEQAQARVEAYYKLRGRS